jgi:uncharacterized BrkB/YihY/UPF0761 family membrane protein
MSHEKSLSRRCAENEIYHEDHEGHEGGFKNKFFSVFVYFVSFVVINAV